ncbi:MAG: HlyD family secretion protein, partial [Bdellovibrionales bacterium]|nr:HlyD family secretion protein [Bdellovibrionales bacterium]
MIKKTVEYIRIPKKVFFSILVFIVLAFVAFSFRPKTKVVDVGKIVKGLFQKKIVDEGMTNFTEKHVITAPADGIIPSHNWQAGNEIKKGEKLFNFEWDRDFVVTSPIDGFVLQVFEKDRKHVQRGTPLMEVGSPKQIEVIAPILSEEVIEVQKGQKALITKWGGDNPLEAVVTKIEPQAKEEISALGVKEQRVNVYLDITTDKNIWQSLGDGFRVEVAIIVKEQDNDKLIPIGSLFSYNNQPHVFIIENRKIKI